MPEKLVEAGYFKSFYRLNSEAAWLVTMRRTGSFFLLLFGLPFAAIGVGAYGAFLWLIYQSIETGSWEKVTADLLHAEISRTSDDGSVTLRPKAKYQYSYQGKEFVGERVALLNMADNIGGFQKRFGDELIRHFKNHIPIDCFVNPDNPTEAVLNRELRYEMLAFMSVFALMFGVIGIAIVAGCLFGNMGGEPVFDAQGYLESSAPESTAIAIALFIYALGLLAPLLFYFPSQITTGNYGAAGFGGVMSLIFLLIAWSCYRVRQQMLRFGKSRLQIREFRLSAEGTITGNLVTETSCVSGTLPLKVKFKCVEEGKGDDSSTTLSKSEQAITANAHVGPGLVVPLSIKFKTPSRLLNLREIPERIKFEIKIENPKGATKFATKFVIGAPLATQLVSIAKSKLN